MRIHRVEGKGDLRGFLRVPDRIYGKDPLWVPPLRADQRSQFDPARNPFLLHCERRLFLLKEGGRAIGRIAAFEDKIASESWGERVGLFGYFECPDDASAATELLNAARDWLRNIGCTAMQGPWSFVSQEWGLVVEGFEPEPVVMAPYNPPYYAGLLEGFGLRKEKDLLCWAISVADGYRIPDRIIRLTDRIAKRYGVSVRRIDLRRYDEEVSHVIRLGNSTLIGNWGYTPVTEAEARAMARDLKPVVRPECVLFAEDSKGKVIGFTITIPDVNVIIKRIRGRMLPFGWARLLLGIPRLRRYRMFGLGVAPEYRGKAIDSLLYRAINESLYSPETWMEINYVLEDNWPMVNAMTKLDAKPSRRYRVYRMEIPLGV